MPKDNICILPTCQNEIQECSENIVNIVNTDANTEVPISPSSLGM